MSIVYKITDEEGRKQTFQGFKRVSRIAGLKQYQLAVVFVDGEIDLWYLDTKVPDALDELRRFYRMDGYAYVSIQIWNGVSAPTSCSLPEAE